MEYSLPTSDGGETKLYDICDVVIVEGREVHRRRSDVGFNSREKAEAWVKEHSR
jgi:hypothetical protein